ncbi:putative sulfate transporter 3-5 [Nymphaea thermarum]|nr:putative sulfate transporter 3-5 [Nymphaea thermarum]
MTKRGEGGERERWAPAPPRRFGEAMRSSLKETFFPDDPFRQLEGRSFCRKIAFVMKYYFPILEWGRRYSMGMLKSDLISGITITSLAIPQGISYAKLANIPPVVGLYSSFVPPLVYAMLGSSKNLAVGTVAAASLLMSSTLSQVASPTEEPSLYLSLVFTSTFISGVLQAALGIFRLGILVDFFSHATVIGFMGGTAIIIILQQLKGLLGLEHFTHKTNVVSVMQSVSSQTHEWRWETAVIGITFLLFLLTTRYISIRRKRLFWISAISPLACVILGTTFVYFTHAEKHGVPIVGQLKRGLNPLSISELKFESKYLGATLTSGLVTGFLALAEGIAVGRSLAIFKHEQIDGNKEMIAFGMMNIVGSCASCYLTTGPFSKSAVNYNAGCRTAASNVVMAIGMMLTLLFLTPLFYYTPLVVLSAIIISAMLGLIKIKEAYHLFRVDKFDFCICMSALFGVVFASMDVGLMLSVGLSIVKALLYVARPGTALLGHVPNTTSYVDIEQYPSATMIPGVLILQLGSPDLEVDN